MAAINTTDLSPILKTYYEPRMAQLTRKKRPFYALVPKKSDFTGDTWKVAFQYGNGPGRAINLARAVANMGPDQLAKVNVERSKNYAAFQIESEAIDAAKGAGAITEGLKNVIDSAFRELGQSNSLLLWRNGGGARGKISAASNVALTVITLASRGDIANFSKGMVLNLGSTDGTSGAKRVGTLTVAAIDRDLGTVTTTAAWNTVAGATAGDFIFQNGDFEATKSGFMGVGAWIPIVTPTAGDNFYGLDRSVDPTLLAGVRYTAGAGGRIEESLVGANARLAENEAEPDKVFMHPSDMRNFILEIGSKQEYPRTTVKTKTAEVSFNGVMMHGTTGDLEVVSDIGVPQGFAYMLQMDTWEFKTLGKPERFIDHDGQTIRMDPNNTDSFIGKLGTKGQLGCTAPAYNAVITLYA